MSNNAIEITDLTVAYDEKPVLWDIDLNIPRGKMMAIVGPNGAGKSTLLKAMLGLLKPVSGSVSFPTDESGKCTIGYVPQSESVDWDFPATAFDVVLMGRYGKLGLFKRPGKADKAISESALEKVGMIEYKNRQISQLSGGQQQRVFIARALVQDSDIYFLDEPLKGVDVKTEKTIVKLLQELRDSGKTVIVVHHDIHTVRDYFDCVTLINMRIVDSGDVEDVFHDENLSRTYRANVSAAKGAV